MAQTEKERKAKKKASQKKYRQSEKGQENSKEYSQREYVKENARNYQASEKGKATRNRYKESGKGQANQMRYNQSDKGNESRRLNVLKYFSKLHSNSDIPCCRCCGQNSHLDFLNMDHIIGKHDMDSIPELVKLGYSSTMKTATLNRWIIKNNYLSDLETVYFQILCKNCNSAKGVVRNNNECPMKNKPH